MQSTEVLKQVIFNLEGWKEGLAAAAQTDHYINKTLIKRQFHRDFHDNADMKELWGGTGTNHHLSHHSRETFT